MITIGIKVYLLESVSPSCTELVPVLQFSLLILRLIPSNDSLGRNIIKISKKSPMYTSIQCVYITYYQT